MSGSTVRLSSSTTCPMPYSLRTQRQDALWERIERLIAENESERLNPPSYPGNSEPYARCLQISIARRQLSENFETWNCDPSSNTTISKILDLLAGFAPFDSSRSKDEELFKAALEAQRNGVPYFLFPFKSGSRFLPSFPGVNYDRNPKTRLPEVTIVASEHLPDSVKHIMSIVDSEGQRKMVEYKFRIVDPVPGTDPKRPRSCFPLLPIGKRAVPESELPSSLSAVSD